MKFTEIVYFIGSSIVSMVAVVSLVDGAPQTTDSAAGRK
jgi:hypothetical protein